MLLDGARKSFLEKVDLPSIEKAIHEAEERTTGEIRVAVLPRFRGTLEEMTEKTAKHLGMTRTRERNGVLIAVDPARRKFRVWGDRALHEKVGEGFWRAIATAVQERFRAGDFTAGLVHGVSEAGKALAQHFPCAPGAHGNQMPDKVDIV